jgi:Uma2 family endonuclease
MTTTSHIVEVEYPESDGLPMGETDRHRNWMIRLIDLFQHRYAGERVYVSGDLMTYYVEGDPRRSVCPDCFVVKDCDPGERRVYKTWDEPAPNAVFEVTSLSTRKRDEILKPGIYGEIGVPEYFLYDPTAEYLNPPLQGFRLTGNGYVRIEADAEGRVGCEELDVWLLLEGRELVVRDRATGDEVVPRWEAAEARREAAEARREAAEAENRRLRSLLDQEVVNEEE